MDSTQPYKYESRHKHAKRRLRTDAGRFLTKKETQALRVAQQAGTCDWDGQGAVPEQVLKSLLLAHINDDGSEQT